MHARNPREAASAPRGVPGMLPALRHRGADQGPGGDEMPRREGPRRLERASPPGDPADEHYPGPVAALLRVSAGQELGRLPWLALLCLRSRFLRPRLAMSRTSVLLRHNGRVAPVGC